QKANAFWRWWAGELLQLVPERFAMHTDRTPLLAIDATGVTLVDPRPGASEQRVELAGLDDARRKAAVRGLLERAGEAKMRALGVSVQGVALREPATAGGAPLDLLPSEQRGDRGSPRERMVRRGLAIAVALLFAVALALPLLQKRSEWLALNPEVEAARHKAE